jgi:CHAD domain-containing protein
MTDSRAQRASASHPPAKQSDDASANVTPALTPADPFLLLAYATLERELAGFAAARPHQDHAPTPHEIHQLRVGARRLRVALRVFRRLLPSAAATRLRADLRWFARALAEVRDLDVYTANFHAYAQRIPADSREALDAYQLYLRRERTEARNCLTAVFASTRYATLFEDAAKLVSNGPSAGALRRWRSLTVRNGVAESLRKSLGRVRRLGNRVAARATPRELHELRIRAKRFRYELEFFGSVYPALQEPAAAVKALQDLLGEHQDIYEATARLRRYAAILRRQHGTEVGLPPALVELRKSQLRHARSIRRAFAARWQAFLALVNDTPRVAA